MDRSWGNTWKKASLRKESYVVNGRLLQGYHPKDRLQSSNLGSNVYKLINAEVLEGVT